MKKPNLYLSSQVYPNILDDREFVPGASTPSESSDAKKQRLLAEHAEAYAKSTPLPVLPVAAGVLVGSLTEGDTATKLVAGLAAMLAANFAQNYLEAKSSDTSPLEVGERIKTGSDLTAALFEAESARRDEESMRRQMIAQQRDRDWINQVAEMQRQWQQEFMRRITPQPQVQQAAAPVPQARKPYSPQAKAYIAPRGRVSGLQLRKA